MKKELKFVFWGTPAVAARVLEILKGADFVPALIVTAPDRPVGRGLKLTPPPVKVWAEQNNVSVLQPEKLDSEFIYKLKANSYKLFIVVAYGKILPEELIKMPALGTLNLHYSLLPRHRGASPVEAAILAGDIETGVSIQRMEFKLDTGPVLAEEKTAIGPDETAPELETRLTELGGELLVKTLPDILANKVNPRTQDESAATFCKKIKKEDGEIRLDEPPEALWRKYRAYAGWPRLFFFKDGKRIIVTKAKFENGQFIVEKIIPEGGRETNFSILK